MGRSVVFAEEKAAGDVAIAAINETAIQPHEKITMPLVKVGQHIPGQRRHAVMEDMQVVVEEEQAKQRGLLDDRRALLMVIGEAVLGV